MSIAERYEKRQVKLVVDDSHLGTSEEEWRTHAPLASLAPLGPLTATRIVIVAPHPDDEVLGAGGLVQRAIEEGVEVKILAVTDGEASYPLLDVSQSCELALRRIDETREALRRLGSSIPRVNRLHMPDGKVSQHRSELLGSLTATLRPGDWCVAPWRRDGHPDHDVCGEAARLASRNSGVPLLSYLVWTWHWAKPGDGNIPWEACRQLPLSRHQRARKRWAIGAFESQTSAGAVGSPGRPVLPAPVLRRFWRSSEVYVDESALADVLD